MYMHIHMLIYIHACIYIYMYTYPWNVVHKLHLHLHLRLHLCFGVARRKNVVYWNPNGRSSMISCAIKSFKRHSQGMSLFMVCVFVF